MGRVPPAVRRPAVFTFEKGEGHMSVFTAECIERFERMCMDGFEQGWHEANGGNLTYRMT